MFKKSHPKKVETTRVVIVGAGSVGATTAYAIMIQGIASEIVLIDQNTKKAQGEVQDLQQGGMLVPRTHIWAGDYKDCKDADIVIITAGLKQKPGQTRLELASANGKIVKSIVKSVKKYTKVAVILMVTNPLDVTTFVATKTARFKPGQVFGSGTALDSARLRYMIGQEMGIDPESVGAYLMGEHGDSSVPIFSHANVMGEKVDLNKAKANKIYQATKNAAYEVIEKKGSTFYAIGLAVARITRAILFDEDHAMTASVVLKGEYGLKNVALSVPVIIGRTGVKKILKISLTSEEKKKLAKSAEVIKQSIARV